MYDRKVPKDLIGFEEKVDYDIYDLRGVNNEDKTIIDVKPENNGMIIKSIEYDRQYSYLSLPIEFRKKEYLCEDNINNLMSQKPKILMTNLFLCSYSGSELHILSMAEKFIEYGYDVTIAVLEAAYPMLGIAIEKGIKVIECSENGLPYIHYEILFIQHYPVANYLIVENNITCDRLVVSKLGTFAVYETLPVFANKADIILSVSKCCTDTIKNEIGEETPILTFENYVEKSFFKKESNNKNNILKHVAIISNHVPTEVVELRNKLNDYEFHCDIYGMQFNQVLITSEILKEYDLVITIGKTVQWCFALEIPVYIYDAFGGPGYITEKNFETARYDNFSGRGFAVKKTGDELLEDIQKNYKKNLESLKYLSDQAKLLFDFDRNFKSFYDVLMNKKPKYHNMIEYYFNSQGIQAAADAKIIQRNGIYSRLEAQIYFDFGFGFSEQLSKKYKYMSNKIIDLVIELPIGVKKIRFDPSMGPCKCKLVKVCIDNEIINTAFAVNALRKDENYEMFLDEDPQYMIQVKKKKVHTLILKYSAVDLTKEEVVREFKKLEKTNCELEEINCELEKTNCELGKKNISYKKVIYEISNSRSWKITKPLRYKFVLNKKKKKTFM